MDSSRHTDTVALITGAGSGIGRALALRMAGEGASVVACDLNSAAVDETLALIREAGFEAAGAVADIATQAGVGAAFAAAVARFGRVDVLANVAGIMDWFLPAHEVDDTTWSRVIAVNVTGPMMLTRAVLPGMMERKRGAIVNVASVGGLGGGSAGVAYTVSKHAVIGLTRSVAWTYRDNGVRCNAVCPGGVETNIGTTAVPRSEWGLAKLTPWHALGGAAAKPDEIAALLSWLASDEASNVNGAVVTDDGGWSAA